eukprot:scaffold585_cov237-Pinguiococcus_pyrenoidosus.AAC.7
MGNRERGGKLFVGDVRESRISPMRRTFRGNLKPRGCFQLERANLSCGWLPQGRSRTAQRFARSTACMDIGQWRRSDHCLLVGARGKKDSTNRQILPKATALVDARFFTRENAVCKLKLGYEKANL